MGRFAEVQSFHSLYWIQPASTSLRDGRTKDMRWTYNGSAGNALNVRAVSPKGVYCFSKLNVKLYNLYLLVRDVKSGLHVCMIRGSEETGVDMDAAVNATSVNA